MGKGEYDGGLHPKDKEILHSAMTGEGLIPITSAEMLKNLCESAAKTKQVFSKIVEGMTKEQAELVRKWRVEEDYTWRGVAQAAWNAGWFNRDWSPPSNQLMGMDLCEKAAEIFNENYMEEPWN